MTILLIQFSPDKYDFYWVDTCSSSCINQYVHLTQNTVGKVKCELESNDTFSAKKKYQLIENTVLKENYEFPHLHGTLSINQFYATLQKKIESFFEQEIDWKITDFFVNFYTRKIVFVYVTNNKLHFKMIRNFKNYIKYFSFKLEFAKQSSKNEKWNDFVDDNYGQWNDISNCLRQYTFS